MVTMLSIYLSWECVDVRDVSIIAVIVCCRRRCETNTQRWWRWSTQETNWSWTRIMWRRSYLHQVNHKDHLKGYFFMPTTLHTHLKTQTVPGCWSTTGGWNTSISIPLHLVVSPPAGKRVLILNGPYRDVEAVLEGIDEKNFSATLTLETVSISWAVLKSAKNCAVCGVNWKLVKLYGFQHNLVFTFILLLIYFLSQI